MDQGLANDRVGGELNLRETDRIGPSIDNRSFTVGIDENEAPDRRVGRHGAKHQRLQPVPILDIDTAGLQHAGNERRLIPRR